MCGIAGIISNQHNKNRCNWLNTALKELSHRGPDDSGWLTISRDNAILRGTTSVPEGEFKVGLLHRRLSIIDLSPGGWQPRSAFLDELHIVFNGEIYNYIELREQLVELGYVFTSNSDTEVLLSAYHKWGIKCVDYFVGMFSFVIVDLRSNTIFMARDHFGIKPLYYIQTAQGELVFSSEIPPILSFSSREICAKSAFAYLRYGITDSGRNTMFQDIFQLEAGHFAVFPIDNVAEVTPQKYWNLNVVERTDISFAMAVEQTREIFFKNMELHLRSDVPVGFALSGGMDSSAIVSVARQLLPNNDLHTFSYDAVDPRYSEKKWFDKISAKMKTNQHLIFASTEEMISDLPTLIGVQGEPFSSTSMYAQYKIFQAAKASGITVMLDGQGGDELLGGYTVYYGARISSMLKSGDINGAISLISALKNTVGLKRLIPLIGNFMLPPGIQGFARSLVGEKVIPDWMRSEWFFAHGVDVAPIRTNYKGASQLKADLFASIFDNTLPRLLRFEDRNSMAHSIESRVPFLTPKFAEFTFSLPENYLISNKGVTKSVFREAMRGIVPNEIIDRTDKLGFNTPEQTWMLELRPFIEQVLSSHTFNTLPMLNQSEIRHDWENILSGKSKFDFRVWRWLNFVLWVEKFGVIFT